MEENATIIDDPTQNRFQPRNTLVVIRRIEDDQQVGRIRIPAGYGEFDQAIIVAVGPGNIDDNGNRCGTDDLKPGMRVLIKSATSQPAPNGQRVTVKSTLPFQLADGKSVELADQRDIYVILGMENDNNESA